MNKKGHVVYLKCKVCNIYLSNIEHMKNFSLAWASEGSSNLRLSNAIDHALGDPHKFAMNLFWKESLLSEEEKAKKVRRDNQQQSVVSGIVSMNAADFEKTKKKFDVAYFLAKEKLPLAKFEKIIDLEKKPDVDLGTAYCNQMVANSFIDSISDQS